MTPLLEEALKAINSSVNVSTGLTHPNDKNRAKELFKRLHEVGEVLLANEIESWAVMSGWQKDDASELGSLAQQIGMGKKVIIKGEPWWGGNIIKILKEKMQSS